jgi:2-succinyl-6-hydroxy-2,4-cyclohexadiene-1-carboxylate synthase
MADALHVVTTGAGPRLVLVHGFTQTAHCWHPVDEAFAVDHEVVAIDAPGHGGSTAVHADLVRGAELLGDAGGRATYLGYSMGGRLCLHLALGRPALVERLVLVAATAGIDDEGERARRRADDERLASQIEADGVEAFLDGWLAQPLFGHLSPAAAHRDERLRNTAEGLASSLRLAGTGSQLPLWDRLAELAMPVLLIVGGDDHKFMALARRMADAIGGNATVVAIPDVHHTAHLEAPASFVAAVREWERRSG